MTVRNGSLTHKNLFLVFSHQTMLHYRSTLLQTMSTLLFSPLLLTGVSEQKQLIEVELFPDFKSDLVSSSMNKTDRIVSLKFFGQKPCIDLSFTVPTCHWCCDRGSVSQGPDLFCPAQDPCLLHWH